MDSIPTLPAEVSHPRGLTEPVASTPRLRRRSITPPASIIVSEKSKDSGLDVERLPSTEYNNVMLLVEGQIQGVIKQALFLQKRGLLIERIVFAESVIYLVFSSVSSLIGASDIDASIRAIFMYIFFALGVCFSCVGLFIKWLKGRQDHDIDAYRNILIELVTNYKQDAFLSIEKNRLQLPPEVLAQGFFRGIKDT
jgi:hypothetical protein